MVQWSQKSSLIDSVHLKGGSYIDCLLLARDPILKNNRKIVARRHCRANPYKALYLCFR
jgi:hypothetical protein